MYNILLLEEDGTKDSRVWDYMQLSGYQVTRRQLSYVDEYKPLLQDMDLLAIECEVASVHYEFCVHLRSITWMPIIVIAKSDEEWEKVKMFQAGIDDYIEVPFRQAEMIARIKAHIERYYRLTRPFGIIEVGEIRINAIDRQVSVRGEYVHFRAKEFALLLYLAQRPNQIISKEELYKAVWHDDDGYGEYNTVAVHVKRIRQLIEKDVKNPKYIETIWGIGYRLLG
ncbi:MAG: winged helix-turn-helix domain-containing protein [Clostridium sp.]|nr:winged helix-turn-helix domain-containing protein [Clostridium sp.]